MNQNAQSENSPDNDAVDAVFVIGTGSKNGNEELKYALRNIERNCPFVRNVYISGECPSFVNTREVIHLKWPDRFHHAKDANIIDKLRHACEHDGIARRILFCSDDQFQTRVCSWDDFTPRWLRQYTQSDKWYHDKKRVWHNRLRDTLERERLRRISLKEDPANVYYYEPHLWMQIDRDKFLDYARWCDYEHRTDTIIASGYFNFINADGRKSFDHRFISRNQTWPVAETHCAYTDSSYGVAMAYLRKEFKNPSIYEIGSKGVQSEHVEQVEKLEKPEPEKKKVCTSCEERRRKAAEQQGNLLETVKGIPGVLNPKEKEPSGFWACKDCAVDHLSKAVSYLGSNAERPSAVEMELAKGEISVASCHILALGLDEAYNRCTEILDSCFNEKSLLTVAEVRNVLEQIV